MNFTELCRLFSEQGSNRNAIADALGLTPDQIDKMQHEAMAIADELACETPGGRRINNDRH